MNSRVSSRQGSTARRFGHRAPLAPAFLLGRGAGRQWCSMLGLGRGRIGLQPARQLARTGHTATPVDRLINPDRLDDGLYRGRGEREAPRRVEQFTDDHRSVFVKIVTRERQTVLSV